MNSFDEKINDVYPGLVVRKDLVKIVKGNAIVPAYVLEYLLGQYCATADEPSIQSGIDTVREILRNHFVHRNESELVKSIIKEKKRHKVIDKVTVSLNEKYNVYEAKFANLRIGGILVHASIIKKNPRLLVGGIWCISELEYEYIDESTSPWILNSLKAIQITNFDFKNFLKARQQFTTDEWIDLLIQSIGFNPQLLSRRNKLLQLIRLIPYCERNYNLIELGPKGTGKSHIYSEFSPHGMLISGGEVTVPKLFVNNSTGKIGLVGYWDTVAFDEFAGKKKKSDKALVDIMKNYMANKTFSRGVEMMGADASMVFVGNTQHPVPHMLREADLFDDLPEKFHDSAFLDRLHFYIPGWEVDIIRGEMFTSGYGFVVDYLAEILRSLRDHDFSDHYAGRFTLSPNISTRDRDGISKTFSGLLKILHPHLEAKADEIEEILVIAIEGRKRIKDQLMRIDQTYAEVDFSYTNNLGGKPVAVTIPEEEQYPDFYWPQAKDPTAHLENQQPEISGSETQVDSGDDSSANNNSAIEQTLSLAANLDNMLKSLVADKARSGDHLTAERLKASLDRLNEIFADLNNILQTDPIENSAEENTQDSFCDVTDADADANPSEKTVFFSPGKLSYQSLSESITEDVMPERSTRKNSYGQNYPGSGDSGDLQKFVNDHRDLLTKHFLENSN